MLFNQLRERYIVANGNIWYHYAKQVFWTETDNPVSLLSDFLDHYDLKKHSFTVYFAIGQELEQYSYADSLSKEVIVKLAVGNLCHLSNVLTDCSLIIEEEREYLKEDKDIDYDMIKLIISKKTLWDE